MSYSDLVNIEEFDTRDYFKDERGDVSYYCKDCKKIVETSRPDPKGYVFTCNNCKGENVGLGTEEGLKSHYKIK